MSNFFFFGNKLQLLIGCQGFLPNSFLYKIFIKSATKVFLNKTTTVLYINKILYSCKSTFDAIMNELRFLLHGHLGHACRSPDAEPNCNFTFDIRMKFINHRWLVGIYHRLDVVPQEIV